jgi:hypothetical protein
MCKIYRLTRKKPPHFEQRSVEHAKTTWPQSRHTRSFRPRDLDGGIGTGPPHITSNLPAKPKPDSTVKPQTPLGLLSLRCREGLMGF